MKVREFNRHVSSDEQKQIVDFATYKSYHKMSSDSTNIEKQIATIEKVQPCDGGIAVDFESGKRIEVLFTGEYTKYDSYGEKQSTGGVGHDRALHNGHTIIFIEGVMIFLERFVLICMDIMDDEMPIDYIGMDANVMDGSGSVFTAEKLQIATNFEKCNLEWCTRSQNIRHGTKLLKLAQINGGVYRFSANDEQLDNLMKNNDLNEIRRYCSTFLKRVK